MKIVTFLVPCYNSQDYMKKCIDSMLRYKTNVEVIIVDDGSTDQTGAIADAYANEYPDAVKVIHQENGGHGAGIMAGVKHAQGCFFKVVDSDDWVDEQLERYVKKLEELEDSEVGLIVNDYVYEYGESNEQEVISYQNVFIKDAVQTWQQSKSFSINQYLTIHSCTFRTEILRNCKLDLPSHTFYEDNLFIYKPLPFVGKLYYMNQPLDHYFIGRPEQSMQEHNLKKRCDHQILVAKKIFEAYDIRKIYKQEPKLGRIMLRENVLMLSAATVFARLNKDEASERKVSEMWRELKKIDAYTTRLIKYRTMAFWVTRPGKLGRMFAIFNYKAAHKVVKFN